MTTIMVCLTSMVMAEVALTGALIYSENTK